MTKKFLFIAGHGKRKDGSFDTGAKGYIKEGEHRFYRDTIFPLMKKYAPDNVIFFSEYNVYSYGNIVSLARSLGCDSVVEWHYDSWTPQSSGGHVIVHGDKTPNRIDEAIRDVIKKHTGLANRTHKGVYGVDARSDFANPRRCQAVGLDYRMVELGFGSNKRDAQIMRNKADEIAKDMIQAICGRVENVYKTRTPILGESTTSINQMRQYAKNNGAPKWWYEEVLDSEIKEGEREDIPRTAYERSVAYGVDPAVTWAQSNKETAFGKYTGVLTPEYKNPCGMKTRKGGDNYDPKAHFKFWSWSNGFSGQAQHLALYAGSKSYPWKTSYDPRNFAFIKGTAPTVEELGGKWAPSESYGTDIVKRMEALRNTKITDFGQDENKASEKVKESQTKKEESIQESEHEYTFDFGIAYAHSNDGESARYLSNVLRARGYKVFDIHTNDISEYDCKTAIQIGGAEVKGSDIKIIGKNEEETAKKVANFLENNDL